MADNSRQLGNWPSSLPSLPTSAAPVRSNSLGSRIPPPLSRGIPPDMPLTLGDDTPARMSDRHDFSLEETLLPDNDAVGLTVRSTLSEDADPGGVKEELLGLENELMKSSEKDERDADLGSVEKDGKKVTARILRTREMALKARQKAKERTAKLEAENVALKKRADILRTENTELHWQIDMLFQRVEGRPRNSSDPLPGDPGRGPPQ